MRQVAALVRDPSTVNEISDSLARAFDRLADFEAVQGGRPPDELLEAVERLQESVGIVQSTRAVIREHLTTRSPDTAQGDVLLGLIVGLTAAELESESGSSR